MFFSRTKGAENKKGVLMHSNQILTRIVHVMSLDYILF